MKALEKLGTYLVRADRSRFSVLKAARLPTFTAHKLWPASDELVSKALKNAWDVVPYVVEIYGKDACHLAHVQPSRVIAVLDRYVHDLAITGELHDLAELAYRMRTYLELKIYEPGHQEPQPSRPQSQPRPQPVQLMLELFPMQRARSEEARVLGLVQIFPGQRRQR